MFEVTMPQLGETVADGTVAKWFKKVGESVTRGEPLFEVSTDKVDTEIPAQASGTIGAILVDEGLTVVVGTLLAVITGEGESYSTSTSNTTVPAIGEVNAPSLAREAKGRGNNNVQLSPVVRRLLAEHNLDVSQVVGSGPQGRITRDDVLAAVASHQSSGDSAKGLQSPIVRRLLTENALDPTSISGSGANGRISRRDVERVIDRGASSGAGLKGDVIVPFTKIRKLTAEHMVRSKATSAHTLMVKEVDYERVEIVRREHGLSFKEREGFGLTYLPFTALAAIEALREFAHLNASVGDNELIVHRAVNLGIAVDLESDGLVVPVLRDNPDWTLTTIARRIRELAQLARNKKLSVDDMTNGTFTISNPGPYGTLLTGAIINQPQVAILSTDGVTRKPAVVTSATGEESITIHSIGLLALTFDHRAVDGAYVARFLGRIAELLDSPNWADRL
jgi:pyruvate dehydrogenase E2 component (dihydrolipoamide acetyltransferase)